VSIREGRFEGQINRAFEKINASIDVDRRLFREDIRGSIAYAKALYKRGLLGPAEQDIIVKGLKSIEKEIEEGSFEFRLEDEDIRPSKDNHPILHSFQEGPAHKPRTPLPCVL